MRGPIGRLAAWGAATMVLASAGGLCAVGPTSQPVTRPATRAAVRVVADLAYFEGATADRDKHKLDLYLPVGRRDVPVVVFVHGGAWQMGDRKRYRRLGRLLAGEGLAAAVISYRLSPGVQHPAHIEDVARAVAWVHAHIGAYGGRPDRLFVMGHSAGGHLVALLALDGEYLEAQGLTAADIRGVIPISGVYRIAAASSRGMMGKAFGTDPEVNRQASPLTHVRKEAPPFCILCASGDTVILRRQAQTFHAALKAAGAVAQVLEVPDRTHVSIIARLGEADDPARLAILGFIREHSN